ncbi:NEAT domain-containing protein [Oceanobacillus sp. FSL K6-2867]|uniref:NEAT domain-containing protein n=1 Tax=Oceanobacillus sp. FSL K6-2867 TaxID=2954748 RepID=UPI0030DACDBA
MVKKQWHKLLSLFSVFVLVLTAILPSTVIYAEEAPLADGQYTIDFEFHKDSTDDKSVMDGYTTKPATLFVDGDTKHIELTLTNSHWIKLFQTDRNGTFVDAEVVSEDTAADKRLVRFPVEDLSEKLDAYTHVHIEDIPGFNYNNYYTVQLAFDETSIVPVEVEEPEQPSDGDENEGNEPEQPVDGDGNQDNEPEQPGDDDENQDNEPEQPGDGDESQDNEPEQPGDGDESQDNEPEQPGDGDENQGNEPEQPGDGDENEGNVPDQSGDGENEGNAPENPSDELTPITLDDGEYTVEFDALHASEDKASSMARYFDSTATLTVEDGNILIDLTILEQPGQLITELLLENNGELEDGVLISEDPDTLSRVEQFAIDGHSTIISAQVDYEVPAANHKGSQPFRISLDLDTISEIETPSEPEEKIEVGTYSIDFNVLKDGTDNISVMDGYTEKPATLFVKESGNFVELTLKNSDWILLFQTDQNGEFVDAEVVDENTEADTRTVRFPVEDLSAKIDAYTHVVVPFINYDNYYTVQFQFDKTSVEPFETEEPEYLGDDDDNENNDPEQPGEEKTPITLDDGEYTVKFDALHASEDKVSSMARYFDSTATLTVEDGNILIDLTILEQPGQLITELLLENNGELEDGVLISEDPDTLSRVEQFAIDGNSTIISAQVDYEVPAANHKGSQPFRISLDLDTVTEVEVPSEPEEPKEPIIEEDEDGNITVKVTDVNNFNHKEADNSYELDYEAKNVHIGKAILSELDVNANLVITGKGGVTATFAIQELLNQLGSSETLVIDFTDITSDYPDALSNVYDITLKADDEAIHTFDEAVRLTFTVDTDKVGNWDNVHIAYINDTDEKEVLQTTIDRDNGVVTADVSHFSIYGVFETIVEDPEEDEETEVTAYTIDFEVHKDGTDEISVMDGYTVKPATLFVGDSAQFVELTLTNSNWIKLFQTDQNGTFVDAEVVAEDTDADTRTVRFPVEDLSSKLDAYTHVVIEDIPGFEYDNYYTVQFAFDEASMEPVDTEGPEQPGDGDIEPTDPEQPGEEDNEPTDPEQPGDEDNNPTDPEQPGDGDKDPTKPGNPSEKPGDEQEIAYYTIDFEVHKDGTDDISVMDGYTLKPAKLFVEDAAQFIELTLTSSNWIKLFQTDQNGTFVDAEVVAEDTDADTRTVRFPVEDLSSKLDAYTHVVIEDIPGFEYDNYYTVQFAFDETSMKAVYTDDPDVDQDPNPNPINTNDPTNTDDSKNKPNNDDGLTYDRNGDTNKTDDSSSKNLTTNTKTTNAKTGDTANFVIFIVLLGASAFILFRKYRLGRL